MYVCLRRSVCCVRCVMCVVWCVRVCGTWCCGWVCVRVMCALCVCGLCDDVVYVWYVWVCGLGVYVVCGCVYRCMWWVYV